MWLKLEDDETSHTVGEEGEGVPKVHKEREVETSREV
jgi:hypothetical protein